MNNIMLLADKECEGIVGGLLRQRGGSRGQPQVTNLTIAAALLNFADAVVALVGLLTTPVAAQANLNSGGHGRSRGYF